MSQDDEIGAHQVHSHRHHHGDHDAGYNLHRHHDYIKHPLNMARLGQTEVVVFPDGQGSAIVHGEVTNGTLVRLQSACQYGEIYGSRECDCREQLDASIEAMRKERSGVLIHLLAHEGRGAGLRAKATAYHLRVAQGLDTFQSYEAQGLRPDVRDYTVATDFLRDYLELEWIKLLTNNPDKIAAVEGAAIKVERMPLVRVQRESSEYLHRQGRPWPPAQPAPPRGGPGCSTRSRARPRRRSLTRPRAGPLPHRALPRATRSRRRWAWRTAEGRARRRSPRPPPARHGSRSHESVPGRGR